MTKREITVTIEYNEALIGEEQAAESVLKTLTQFHSQGLGAAITVDPESLQIETAFDRQDIDLDDWTTFRLYQDEIQELRAGLDLLHAQSNRVKNLMKALDTADFVEIIREN